MKLQEYMAMAKISDAQLGEMLGKDRSAVTKYRLGSMTPPLEVIAQIERATSGAVSFRDFLSSDAA